MYIYNIYIYIYIYSLNPVESNHRDGPTGHKKEYSYNNTRPVYILYIYSVSPKINIKGGGHHLWYMTFGKKYSISVVKQCFSA